VDKSSFFCQRPESRCAFSYHELDIGLVSIRDGSAQPNPYKFRRPYKLAAASPTTTHFFCILALLGLYFTNTPFTVSFQKMDPWLSVIIIDA
jgi:hypothetical protein